MRQKSVNRSLNDPALDDVDHALGRPRDPLGETYRNHYCIDTDGKDAQEMRASSWWVEGVKINGGNQTMFYVSDAGRQALAAHLKSESK